MVDKLKNLKRSKYSSLFLSLPFPKSIALGRKDMLDNPDADDDAFDIAVEEAISDRPSKRIKSNAGANNKLSRQARDKKFGFGGVGKRSKQNTRRSTDDFESKSRGGGSHGGVRAGKSGKRSARVSGNSTGAKRRLGKQRRLSARSKS
jgi:rRNA-processing protein EBP2